MLCSFQPLNIVIQLFPAYAGFSHDICHMGQRPPTSFMVFYSEANTSFFQTLIMKRELTASRIFSSVTVFDMISGSLNMCEYGSPCLRF